MSQPTPPTARDHDRSHTVEAVPLQRFLCEQNLPAVVRLSDGVRFSDPALSSRSAELDASEQQCGVDLSKPLLLFKNYEAVKIQARSLHRSSSGQLRPQGACVVVPDSYRGWMSVVDERGHALAACYTSLAGVIAAGLTVVLTRHSLHAYTAATKQRTTSDHRASRTPPSDNESGAIYNRVTIDAGNVLRVLGVFADLSISTGRHASRHSRSANYAQCLNYKNEVFFVPLHACGRFYAAATTVAAAADTSRVCLVSHILRRHRLPVCVRLVCGYLPRGPSRFNGLLRLEEYHREYLVLGCTLPLSPPPISPLSPAVALSCESPLCLNGNNPRPEENPHGQIADGSDLSSSGCRLFELRVHSPLFVRLESSTLVPGGACAVRRALFVCRRHGDKWRSQMNVRYDIIDSSETKPTHVSGEEGEMLTRRFAQNITPQEKTRIKSSTDGQTTDYLDSEYPIRSVPNDGTNEAVTNNPSCHTADTNLSPIVCSQEHSAAIVSQNPTPYYSRPTAARSKRTNISAKSGNLDRNKCNVKPDRGGSAGKRLTKTKSLDDGRRRTGRSLSQTVARFLLSRVNHVGNTDVTSSFIFRRPDTEHSTDEANFTTTTDPNLDGDSGGTALATPITRISRNDAPTPLSPLPTGSCNPENIYSEIYDATAVQASVATADELPQRMHQLRILEQKASSGAVSTNRPSRQTAVDTMQLGSDGRSSQLSSPGDTIQQCRS